MSIVRNNSAKLCPVCGEEYQEGRVATAEVTTALDAARHPQDLGYYTHSAEPLTALYKHADGEICSSSQSVVVRLGPEVRINLTKGTNLGRNGSIVFSREEFLKSYGGKV